MNLLIDRLPSSVWIGDAEYAIRTNFRISILFELLMQNSDVEPDWKPALALRLYFPVLPENLSEAAEAVFWFYQCGKERRGRTENGTEEKEQRIYSFDFDDESIYAAFLEQYGIDLNEAEGLHWWKFRALFLALKEECEFRRIMGYRAMEITNNMSQKDQAFYREMKERYRIPRSQSEEEKLDAIEAALLGDGDLTGLL